MLRSYAGSPVVSSAALARASAAGVRSLAPRGGRAALAELYALWNLIRLIRSGSGVASPCVAASSRAWACSASPALGLAQDLIGSSFLPTEACSVAEIAP